MGGVLLQRRGMPLWVGGGGEAWVWGSEALWGRVPFPMPIPQPLEGPGEGPSPARRGREGGGGGGPAKRARHPSAEVRHRAPAVRSPRPPGVGCHGECPPRSPWAGGGAGTPRGAAGPQSPSCPPNNALSSALPPAKAAFPSFAVHICSISAPAPA